MTSKGSRSAETAVAAVQPGARKRQAVPLNQLPYQRKLTFRRRAYISSEDRLQDLLGRSVGAEAVRIVLGRVVGKNGQRDVVLPLASEVILDGPRHEFDPALTQHAYEQLRAQMEAQHAAWRASRTGRWAEVSLKECMGRVPRPPAQELTFYSPGGFWHYQVQVGSAEPDAGRATGQERREVTYVFQKDASHGGIWWSLTLCTEEASHRLTAELGMNTQLLWEQHRRMCTGKVHSFNLIARDLLRNARSIVAALREGEQQASSSSCYYPGPLEPAAEVLKHYDQKAAKGDSGQPSESEKVRRYNNLLKVLLVERWVDHLPAPVRVLDLGCGMGQDLQKYSRAFRGERMETYVGIDFAPEAVQEARRRYARLAQQRPAGDEYAAAFYVGDLRSAEVFEQLALGGHSCFDVISMQFTLQYLAESESIVREFLARAAGLLRPGGYVVGSIPSSEAIADLYEAASRDAGASAAAELRRGNSLYSVSFRGATWARVGHGELDLGEVTSRQWGVPYTFSLVDAVDSQEEYVVPWEAFEELAGSLGLQVELDAPFPEVYQQYAASSRFYSSTFSQDERNTPLTADEEELFGFYTSFVLKRVDGGGTESGGQA